MNKHIDFGEIEQFRNVIREVQQKYRYFGKDENGNAIYDSALRLPTVAFTGTVKLHGTNAGIGYSRKDGLWVQSRNRIIDVQHDNCGFANWVELNKETILDLIHLYLPDTAHKIIIYGEWAGKGIQSGVAINNLDKTFFVIGAKVFYSDEDYAWSYINICDSSINMYSLFKFKTFYIDIDFNYPHSSQNKLVEFTEAVEAECPVAKIFGISGTGEGIVWTGTDDKGNFYRFKVKGEKHSVTKVKKLAEVDVEKINSLKEFAEYAVTPQRLEQAISAVGSDDIKQLGDILRWVVNDVHKEESDTLESNGLDPKEVNKYLSLKAKELYFEH